jgi:hypothetical protein
MKLTVHAVFEAAVEAFFTGILRFVLFVAFSSKHSAPSLLL